MRQTPPNPIARTALLAVFALCAATATAAAQEEDISEETVAFFQQNCTSCHTIGGGRLAGPDLKGVTERRDEDWLSRFVVDPKAMIDSGDAYAQALLKDANGAYMPTIPGLSKDRALKLVRLVAFESTKEKSRFVGLQVSDRPLTAVDVERGRRLFEGRDAFAAGAPACISCHEVSGTEGFGGGRLGPDLTDVFSRLEGRKALAAWLGAPPSLTMQPVFKDRSLEGEEVLALVAYLKSTAETGRPDPARGSLAFLIAGVAGLAGVLVAFDLVWRRRFRAVRRPLVRGVAR